MPGTGSALTMHGVVELLDRDFGGALAWPVMQAAVRTAVSDLSGSISAEALHEMAYQLARHRLAAHPVDRAGPPAVDLVGAGRH